MSAPAPEPRHGILAWFASNHVAANLLMIFIFAVGFLALTRTKIEVMPELKIDMVTVSVVYPGASPTEVETGIVTRIEQAIDGIEGIEKIRSVASEGGATVIAELDDAADGREVLDEIQVEVERITTFPIEAERPVITEVSTRQGVIDLVLYGDVPESTLKALAETARDELTALPEVSVAELSGVRRDEISIELSEDSLRRHGLSFARVAGAVRGASLDLPSGSIRTTGGEILLRVAGERRSGAEFAAIPVLSRSDGTQLLLGEVATVIDGFEDTDRASRFEGSSAAVVKVYRVGDQGALDVARAVRDYVEGVRDSLPAGVDVDTWRDESVILKSRIDLLVRNALMGLVLVFICLSLFLDLRLAFWTMMGIPIGFLGSFLIFPQFDISVNMISLFAFIIVLGIVVDDAIVVGEGVFHHRLSGKSGVDAAIAGVRELAAPVSFAIATTIAAFLPLIFVEGIMGKFLLQIPIVVIAVLIFSLVDCLFVLPAHLAEGKRPSERGPIARLQATVRLGLDWVIVGPYAWSLDLAVRWRYVTVAFAVSTLLVTFGAIRGDWVKFEFLPEVDADNVIASLRMPQGTPREETEDVTAVLEAALRSVQAELDVERRAASPRAEGEPELPSIVRAVRTTIGRQPTKSEQEGPGLANAPSSGGSHLAEVNVELLEGSLRGVSSHEVARRWRLQLGEVAGISSLVFSSSLFTVGDPISIELAHRDVEVLREASTALKERLARYPGVFGIDDSFLPGKVELRLELTDAGRALGVTLADLAGQTRDAFYGAEVQRLQRGDDDVKVMVRRPESERLAVADLEASRVRLADGTEVPFVTVARVAEARGYASIDRTDRRRVVKVTADVDAAVASSGSINAELEASVLPELVAKRRGLSWSFEGQRRQRAESMASLFQNFIVAMFAIFGLLAILFRSYVQPLIVMSAIPFGIVGAVIGHIVMGYNLSLMSFFGIVALAGVVVNDSLILIDKINRDAEETGDIEAAVRSAGARRFRPILLTTLTTFFGLMPMILETSLQAKFLIPMALSLAFGVLFATFITLVLVPALYLVFEDAKRLASWSWS